MYDSSCKSVWLFLQKLPNLARSLKNAVNLFCIKILLFEVTNWILSFSILKRIEWFCVAWLLLIFPITDPLAAPGGFAPFRGFLFPGQAALGGWWLCLSAVYVSVSDFPPGINIKCRADSSEYPYASFSRRLTSALASLTFSASSNICRIICFLYFSLHGGHKSMISPSLQKQKCRGTQAHSISPLQLQEPRHSVFWYRFSFCYDFGLS